MCATCFIFDALMLSVPGEEFLDVSIKREISFGSVANKKYQREGFPERCSATAAEFLTECDGKCSLNAFKISFSLVFRESPSLICFVTDEGLFLFKRPLISFQFR